MEDQERGGGLQDAAAISELSLNPPGTFLSTGSEEPSSRPTSARPPTSGGGGGSAFVAAPPPARQPSRGGAPAVRRKFDHAAIGSPRPGSRADDAGDELGGAYGLPPRSANSSVNGRGKGDMVQVTDMLGPRVISAANEFAEIIANAGTAWATLHTLMHSATKERGELMVNVARQESLIAEMQQQADQASLDHADYVRQLQAKANQEQEEALHAARLRFDEELAQKLQELRQEEAKARADAVAEVAEQAEHDKATALAEAREAAEQELTQALAVARQRAEEEKLEALEALRQRASKEQREALAAAKARAEVEMQAAVAAALERADAIKDRLVQEQKERASQERKQALAAARDQLQQEKYRALEEERDRARMAVSRVVAVEEEKLRAEKQRTALERAANQEKATCAACAHDYIVQENSDSACKCVHRGSTAQVHVEGLLWHAGAELTDWVKMRRRWSCCPQNEIMGTFADLQKIGCRAHVALPP